MGMLSWISPVVIGLIGILFMNCGVLYMMFDSSFDEMCNYEGVINTCDEFPSYMSEEDQVFQSKTKHNEWLQMAYALRNNSEHAKCEAERILQTQNQYVEKQKAQEIATSCMHRFSSCVAMLVTTTTTTQTFNCSVCQQYCRVTDWTLFDWEYAKAMSYVAHHAYSPFPTRCMGPVCPWGPECGVGSFMEPKCAARGCTCNKYTCTTTTTTMTTTNTSTTTTTTTSTSTSTSTSSATSTNTSTTTRTLTSSNTSTTPYSTTTTNTSTTTRKTTTNTSTTTTSTTSTATTTNTSTEYSTSTSSNTSTTTSTTTTESTTNTTTVTTVTSTNTSTTPPPCKCPATEIVGVAFVGRPWRRFAGDTYQTPPGVSTVEEEAKYWQGIYVGAEEDKMLGQSIETNCFDYFSNRSNYYGPRQAYVANYQKAMDEHFDLACGYTGNFHVRCSQEKTEVGTDTCRWYIDTSTCLPPSYETALQECYDIPVTTPPPTNPPPTPVDNFLEVEEMPLNLDPAPHVLIPTVKPPTEKCCTPHVASVCRPDVNFMPGDAGADIHTKQGEWQPDRSISGAEGFFPMVPCRDQYNSTPRPCPQVRIKHWEPAFALMDTKYQACMKECNADRATAELNAWCKAEMPDRVEKEVNTTRLKVESMEAAHTELEEWTEKNSWLKVRETKQVIDCVDQEALPQRYNSLAFPKVRSGFYQMPLHNQCRLHECKPNQCLEVKKRCRTPYIHEGKEVETCEKELPATHFECKDKVGISSSNPLSLGFGITWVVLGLLVTCGAVGLAWNERQMTYEGGAKVYPYQPSD